MQQSIQMKNQRKTQIHDINNGLRKLVQSQQKRDELNQEQQKNNQQQKDIQTKKKKKKFKIKKFKPLNNKQTYFTTQHNPLYAGLQSHQLNHDNQINFGPWIKQQKKSIQSTAYLCQKPQSKYNNIDSTKSNQQSSSHKFIPYNQSIKYNQSYSSKSPQKQSNHYQNQQHKLRTSKSVQLFTKSQQKFSNKDQSNKMNKNEPIVKKYLGVPLRSAILQQQEDNYNTMDYKIISKKDLFKLRHSSVDLKFKLSNFDFSFKKQTIQNTLRHSTNDLNKIKRQRITPINNGEQNKSKYLSNNPKLLKNINKRQQLIQRKLNGLQLKTNMNRQAILNSNNTLNENLSYKNKSIIRVNLNNPQKQYMNLQRQYSDVQKVKQNQSITKELFRDLLLMRKRTSK